MFKAEIGSESVGNATWVAAGPAVGSAHFRIPTEITRGGNFLHNGVFLGNGDGTFHPAPLPQPSLILAVADFKNDGIPDVLSGYFVTQLGRGDGSFGPEIVTPPPYPYPYYPPGSNVIVTVGDFNNDDFADVAWENAEGDEDYLFGNGDGTFRYTRTGLDVDFSTTTLFFTEALIVADVNGDGKPDIIEQGDSGIEIRISNRTDQTYPPPDPILYSGYTGPLAIADFDGDKKLDLASYFFVYPGNGDGTFRDPTTFGQMTGIATNLLGYAPPPLLAVDINGDGKPDLIGVGPISDTISVLINNSGTPVASAAAYLTPTGEPVLAPGAIATLYGAGLSTTTTTATLPLPTMIGNTSIELVDYAGNTFQAPLLYVSPTQINFQVPDNAAIGLAIINVTGNGRPKGAHSTMIQPVATGIFTLDGSGHGAPVASAVNVASDGTQTPIPTNLPIPVSSTSQVYLSLYGTGFRYATGGTCMVGHAAVIPSYFGPQGSSPVIDQINLLIPSNTPKGPMNITCQLAARDFPATRYGNGNTVTVTVQ